MKLRTFFDKCKNSMFLIVLFIVGIGIIVAINLPRVKSVENKETTKKKSTNVKKGGDKEINVSKPTSNQKTNLENNVSNNLIKVTQETLLHNNEIVDNEELNQAIKSNGSRTYNIEIPFFNAMFQLPNRNDYQFLEKDDQINLFGEQKDSKRHYIYTIKIEFETAINSDPNSPTRKDETIIGFSAIKFRGGAQKYLEEKKNNLENGKILYSPTVGINEKLPEYGEKEIHDTKFIRLFAKESDGRYSCEYVTDCGEYVLDWKVLATQEYLFYELEDLLKYTTIVK